MVAEASTTPTVFDPLLAEQAIAEERLADLARSPATKAALPAPTDDPFKLDFRKFLWAVWKHLNLPEPTPIQLDMAKEIASDEERLWVAGFRGVGKSWITVAYVLWELYRDSNKRILVVSAGQTEAGKFVKFCLDLIYEMPLLQVLKPENRDRQSALAFDVRGARPDKQPSVTALGVFGQLAGNRADIIVPDDIETASNALTVATRARLSEAIKEFSAIIKPGGKIRYLGTPQSEQSVYSLLPDRGYTIRYFPFLIPDDKQEEYYGARLAPSIRRMKRRGAAVGECTEGGRFSPKDVHGKRLEYGASGFALQFQLDTRLEDAERFPLKLKDLVVMSLDQHRGPESLAWAADPRTAIPDLPVMGFNGDQYYSPVFVSEVYTEYLGVKMAVDPSGRGGDETAYSITSALHGTIFLQDAGGFTAGFDEATLVGIATKMLQFRVTHVVVEDNYGGGMFTALLRPVVERVYKAEEERRRAARANDWELARPLIEDVHHSVVQKELRIIDTLEPVMNQHRLVVAKELIVRDHIEADKRHPDRKQRLSLFYQMSHITKERGSLPNDDRLDTLAMGVEAWQNVLSVDPAVLAQREAEHREQQFWERHFGDGQVGLKDPYGRDQGAARRTGKEGAKRWRK